MGFLRRKQPEVPVRLTRQFPPKDYAAALESWAFLDIAGMTPLLTSQFGDVVLAREGDGVYLLDVVTGTLTREWENVDAMADALETAAGRERYLRASLVAGASHAGKVPDDSNPTDFVVTVNLDGQIHEQVRAQRAE